MIGKFLLGISLALSTPAVCSATKVELPCESGFQDLSPDGTHLLVHCKDHSLQLAEISSGAHREILPAERRANSIAFSQDGKWLALGFEDGTVRVLPTQGSTSGTKEWKASAHSIELLYFLPNGNSLVAGPLDSPGQVWELAATPTQRATLATDFGGLAACAAGSDGKLLVTAAGDTVLRLYDVASWQKVHEYRDFLLDTFTLTFTPDNKQVIAAGADSRITILDAATATQVRQLPPEPGSYVTSLDLLDGGTKAVTLYLDDAGEKPPHALIWNLSAATSAPIKSDSPPTCGGVVKDKLWLCTVQGRVLTVTQME